jgi:hypothetical protein
MNNSDDPRKKEEVVVLATINVLPFFLLTLLLKAPHKQPMFPYSFFPIPFCPLVLQSLFLSITVPLEKSPFRG